MANETSDHLELLEDLLIDIFLRSSAKSLLHEKCVCKHWYALIRNKNFVFMHLQYQKDHGKGRLLLQHFEKDTEQYRYALIHDETLVRNLHHDLDHLHMPSDRLHMEGPVNGLYCLFDDCDRIIVWNPTLMEVRILPLPQTHFYRHDEHFKGVIGFGLDPFTHDYKVVLIRDLCYTSFLYVTMYNLTTNTWKLFNLGDFSNVEQICSSLGSSFKNGSYYWCTMTGEVIAFDMGEETFRHILGPDLCLPKEMYNYYLTTYNDKITFLQGFNFSIDLWVMLEEGIWFKQNSFTSITSNPWIVGLWKNNELLLAVGVDGETSFSNPIYQMVSCNAFTQEMRNVGPKGDPSCIKASIYYESLVSVDSRTHHKGKHASLNTISDFFRIRHYYELIYSR